jgi:hypothetical protein
MSDSRMCLLSNVELSPISHELSWTIACKEILINYFLQEIEFTQKKIECERLNKEIERERLRNKNLVSILPIHRYYNLRIFSEILGVIPLKNSP